jgi:zinc/manganese transport system substrate-binding protein
MEGRGQRLIWVLLCLALMVAGCGGRGTTTASLPRGDVAPCPVQPIDVVVSVDQWGDLVERLGGACTAVTTIVRGSAGDPHDYEPTPVDLYAFSKARLVVLNGLGYDTWARRALDGVHPAPAVVDAGAVAGRAEGDNPHIWYDPAAVHAVLGAVTGALGRLAPDPDAVDYFGARAAAVAELLRPYDGAVADVAAAAGGRTYAASEPVADYLAAAVGLHDVTPTGYRRAATNGSEPAPGDVDALRRALTGGTVDVLLLNTQTEGVQSAELRNAARRARVPVVEVTETIAPGADGFVAWQVGQLHALAASLT